ncbi:ABC transporter permease [Kitasatospora terrestris]
MLAFFGLIAVIGPWIAPFDPDARSTDLMEGPSGKHWLGTTHLGQDIFSQLLVGTRSIILVGVVAGVLATVVAVLVGVTSGYLSGPGAETMSAISNVFLVIPALPLIIIVSSVMPHSGDLMVALIIGMISWAWGARVLRAQTLSLRRRDFVVAAKATGESTFRVVVFEILPNLTAIIASSFIGTVMYAVMTEISLAFIGIPGMSPWNWGVILYWAQTQQALGLGAWWWFVPAGLAIALLGTALSLVNFGIDEIVNPRLRTAGRDLKTPAGRIRMRPGFTPVVRTAPVAVPATPVVKEGAAR